MPVPRRLTRSSRIAVAAPASAPFDLNKYSTGLETLKQRGLTVEAPPSFEPMGYLAGPDDVRRDRFQELLFREDIDAIICARGGYGSSRIIPYIDYERIPDRIPLLVGYSDITALQLALLTKAGVPSLSGPMVYPDWADIDEHTENLFWRFAGGEYNFEIGNPGERPLYRLREGQTEGMLIGGNLSVLTSLVGTEFFPDMTGAILFLEDVNEAPYRVDRMMSQLKMAGVFGKLSGLIFGAITSGTPPSEQPSLHMREVVEHYAHEVDGPIAAGLVYGHRSPFTSLPIGVSARLDVTPGAGVITLLEPLTA